MGLVPRWRTLAQRASWGELGYGLLRLPVSAVALTVSVTFWSASLVMLALPLYNKYLPAAAPSWATRCCAARPSRSSRPSAWSC